MVSVIGESTIAGEVRVNHGAGDESTLFGKDNINHGELAITIRE